MFTDNFNRANENLEDSADWTRSGGIAGGATVTSNQVEGVDTDSVGSVYKCPDQGSADHYTEVVVDDAGAPFPCCVRLTDGNNFIGARRGNIDQCQFLKRDAGTFTFLKVATISSSGTPTFKIEAEGNTLRLYINDVLNETVTESFNNTETGQGLIARGGAVTNLCDNFEADSIAGGGGTDVLAQTLQSIEEGNVGLSRAMHNIDEGFVA